MVPHFSSGILKRAKRDRAGVSPFLAWGDFHARSRFPRSTIPEEKRGTTPSLEERRFAGCETTLFINLRLFLVLYLHYKVAIASKLYYYNDACMFNKFREYLANKL